VYGVDLAQWYTRRRWPALLDLIDGLPATSRLREAVLNDPEQAELIAALPEPDVEQAWRPSTRDFTLEVMLLRENRELLASAVRYLAALAGAEQLPEFDAFPVPETELDRARVARAARDLEAVIASGDSLIALLTPHAL